MDKVLDTFVIKRPDKPLVIIRQYSKRLVNVVIEYRNGTFAIDWPLRYDDGRVAYDNPHGIPAYVKRWVERII